LPWPLRPRWSPRGDTQVPPPQPPPPWKRRWVASAWSRPRRRARHRRWRGRALRGQRPRAARAAAWARRTQSTAASRRSWARSYMPRTPSRPRAVRLRYLPRRRCAADDDHVVHATGGPPPRHLRRHQRAPRLSRARRPAGPGGAAIARQRPGPYRRHGEKRRQHRRPLALQRPSLPRDPPTTAAGRSGGCAAVDEQPRGGGAPWHCPSDDGRGGARTARRVASWRRSRRARAAKRRGHRRRGG
jgi:hypothetical protein